MYFVFKIYVSELVPSSLYFMRKEVADIEQI